jgi:hypothetical protein
MAAARAAEAEPDELTERYGLGERALLRRLPALTRLVAGRRVLLALHRALAEQGGALEEWRAWPVRWRYMQGTHPCALDMDGEATIVLPGRAAGWWRVGYLWDGEASVPREVLWERLEQLDAISRSEAYTTPRPARVPPVLLVTAQTDRVPPGYRPGMLWTTTAEIAAHGPLAAPWHGAHLHCAPRLLAAALATLGTLPPRPTPGSSLAPAGAGAAVPRLAERARALRDGIRGGEDDSAFLLALAIPPRAWAILAVVGAHPLLAATSVAEACTLARSDAWHVLAVLCRHGLLAPWTPSGGPRWRRYVLTTRGLQLLARQVGITPEAYRRIYGALDDACGEARRGLVFARANLAHTDGINSVYLALLDATRLAGGELCWRGEWACTHTYLAGQRLHTLRPDAEGLFTGPQGSLRFYVEVDRGTTRLWRLAGKLSQYYAYRAGTDQRQITLLLVTSRKGRGREAMRLNEMLAVRLHTHPLDLCVTTEVELVEQGPRARFWRAVTGTCSILQLYAGATQKTAGTTDRQSCQSQPT